MAGTSSRGKSGRLARALRSLLGVALAAGFLALAFRDVQWDQVGRVARGTSFGLLLGALLLGTTNLGVRTLRWRLLLAPAVSSSLGRTFWVICVGYLGNCVLPMRAGDVGRSWLVSRGSGSGASYALATTMAERIIDAVFLVVVGGTALFGHPALPSWLARGIPLVAGSALVALGTILILPVVWDRIASWAEAKPRFAGVALRLNHPWLKRFVQGLASIRRPGRLALFLILTCVIWSIDAITTVVVGQALGLHIPFLAALVLLAALGVSSAIPLTPGQVGVYQWVAASVVGSYGIEKEPAVLLALTLQALSYLLLVLWGMLGVFRLAGHDLVRTLTVFSSRPDLPSAPSEAGTELPQ